MSQNTGLAPGRRDRLGGGVERERRHHHLVARPDAHRPQRDRDRLGAVGHADGVRRAAVGGELALERAHLRAQDVALGVEHPRRSPRAAPRAAPRSGVEVSNSGTPIGAQRAASSSRSARVISRISSSKLVCGFQPRSRSALDGVADQVVDLGRAHERRVDRHVPLEVAQAGLVEGDLAALAHRVRLAGGDHVVLGRSSRWSISHIAST